MKGTMPVARAPVTPSIERDRCPTCGRAIPYWTRDRIIEAFQRWNREYGSPPKAHNWSPRSTPWHPTINMVRLVFGNWNDALIAAGFSPRHRHWTRAEIKQAMFEWAYAHGRPPTSRDWAKASPSRPSLSTVRLQFGSWNAGLRAAGYQTYRQGQSKGMRAA